MLLDLSSAFDTVDHETLLNVLNHWLLIDEPPLKWLRSYLTACTQVFSVNGAESASLPVDCSVPQGSVLGPIQFISYTEDVTVIFDTHKLRHHLFADDKQRYSSVTVLDINKAKSTLVLCVADVQDWCASRRLQLNASKTEVIRMGTRQRLQQLMGVDLSLTIDSVVIKPLKVVRDLGVFIDEELTFKQHVV